MSTVDIIVPDIGDVESVEVIEILVSAGDSVAIDDSLLTVESDKASMEIPAAQSGVITSIDVEIGSQVKAGDRIGRIEVVLSGNPAAATDASETPAVTQPDLVLSSSTDDITPTTPSSSANNETSEITVAVPDIGDVDEVEVIELLVDVGDAITVDQSIATLESDKASMEIPSTHAGTVKSLHVQKGDRVSQGALLATLASSQPASDQSTLTDTLPSAIEETSQQAAAAAPTPGSDSPVGQSNNTGPDGYAASQRPASPTAHLESSSGAKVYASPGVRRYAREHGADLTLITGSGRKNRVLKTDVKAFIKQSMQGMGSNYGGNMNTGGGAGIPSIPEIDFSKFGNIERVALGRINKLSAANLHRAWLNVPMVTHHDEADITEMEAFRQALKAEAREGDPKITGLAFHMKALVQSLKSYPKLNSSMSADGQSLIYKQYYHIGIAVDTSNGLVVPVFKDVDKKSISELAVEMSEVSKRARDKKLKPDEMQGASMTISSLGGIGGSAFTPIVNTPEVAILGITRARMQPVWNGKEFEPRLMCPLDLTYDHRVVDGADAARFMAHYCTSISDVRRLLI